MNEQDHEMISPNDVLGDDRLIDTLFTINDRLYGYPLKYGIYHRTEDEIEVFLKGIRLVHSFIYSNPDINIATPQFVNPIKLFKQIGEGYLPIDFFDHKVFFRHKRTNDIFLFCFPYPVPNVRYEYIVDYIQNGIDVYRYDMHASFYLPGKTEVILLISPNIFELLDLSMLGDHIEHYICK